MKTIVAYCRTANALGSDPMSGIMDQANAIQHYATRHGFIIHETYRDPGMSGISLERPALQRLLADCRTGKIAIVLTTDADRLSRDTGQLFALIDIFRDTGVHVEFNTSAGRASFASLTVLLSAAAEVEGAAANA
jgi:site-specific DNA recombinase